MRVDLDYVRSILSDNESLVATAQIGGLKPDRRRITKLFPTTDGSCWGVHQNSYSNILRAVTERVFTVELDGKVVRPPRPVRGHLFRELGSFRNRILSKVTPVPVWTATSFVESYTGRKRSLYDGARREFELRGIEAADARIEAFIKDEKTNLTAKIDPCPRIIQPRKPIYNLAIGRYLKPMEKPIFRGIAEVFRDVTVMKGYNADERGAFMRQKWESFNDPVAVLLDAKRFDQHVSHDALQWEASIFQALTEDPAGYREIDRLRKVNRCTARADDGVVKYTVHGCRMSGDMDTALGNCLLMCGMTWSFMKNLSITKFRYANDGDDGVLFVERKDLNQVLENFREYFLSLGFTMKLEGIAYEFEEIEFCQARPVLSTTGWRMVRDPRVCIDKDTFSLKNVRDTNHARELRNAIGWAGLALAGDMPIFCKLYSRMVTGDCPQLQFESGMEFLARGMDPKWAEPTDETRASFYFAYGITPDEQTSIEHVIENLHWTDDTPTPVESFTDLFTLHY